MYRLFEFSPFFNNFFIFFFVIINLLVLYILILNIRNPKRTYNLMFSIIIFVLFFVFDYIFICSYNDYKTNEPETGVLHFFSNLNPYIILGISIILCALAVHFYFNTKHGYKKTISKNAIKESLDNSKSGICFYDKNGLILFYNQTMLDDCMMLTNMNLLNGNELFNRIELDASKEEGFRKDDSNVYLVIKNDYNYIKSFKRLTHYIDGKLFFELISIDISKEYHLYKDYESYLKDLKSMNEQLRSYSEKVDEYIRKKEILNAKVKIHSEMGELLLYTKKKLDDNDYNEFTSLIKQWQEEIVLFQTLHDNGENNEGFLDEMIKVGNDVGIKVLYDGAMLKKGSLEEKILASAIHEEITNTISHAKGDTLFVKVNDSNEYYICTLKNNGIMPTKEIEEGGGLSSLRCLIEQNGGIMKIKSLPEFIIEVKIKKQEKGE